MKKFDLNIETILESWEVHHAIREIIANGIDEQLLTTTKNIEISKHGNSWCIRDYGRGLKYTHLTQNENQEKLSNPKTIGKFGIGLKDALATFDRNGVKVYIQSKYGMITLTKTAKQGFSDITTLHANISEATDSSFVGTQFLIEGVADKDIENAKHFFLRFTGENVLQSTSVGEVIRKVGNAGNIYINGVKVAEEPRFLFSYNITQISAPIKKALNRERTNVGRTAYTESVKKILLTSKSPDVAKELVEDLQKFQQGESHDELSWLDVQEHAVRILNHDNKSIFVSHSTLLTQRDMIDQAKATGRNIIAIPENLANKIKGGVDYSGNPIVDISQFVINYNDSFEFRFVNLMDLTAKEKIIYNYTEDILSLIGGRPDTVKEIKISTTMRKDFYAQSETVGIWDHGTKSIIILRKQLRSLRDYAGTLVHEALHARSGHSDVSRDFEHELTAAIGQICEEALSGKSAGGGLK